MTFLWVDAGARSFKGESRLPEEMWIYRVMDLHMIELYVMLSKIFLSTYCF